MKSTRYLLSLATVMLLVGLMLVPAVPTLAAEDTTDITGNVTVSISITAPPAFSLMALPLTHQSPLPMDMSRVISLRMLMKRI